MMNALEIVILSGFLGSGKTTLLVNRLTQADMQNTAVIVNEVGQIDIDGAVVSADASLPSVLLTNGCVCCSMGNDLLDTIEQLQVDRVNDGKNPFKRMIIECSGLSKPGPIIRSLRRLPVTKLDIRILTVFDIIHGRHCLESHEEVAAQLAAAHAVVLTKTDIGTESDLQAARHWVQQINPFALVVNEKDPQARAQRAFDGLNCIENDDALFRVLSEDKPGPLRLGHHSVKTLLIHLSPNLNWERISNWLEDLASYCGDGLLRLKGFVQPMDSRSPLLVQSVGTVFSTPSPMAHVNPERHGLVLITRGVFLPDLVKIDPGVVANVQANPRSDQQGLWSSVQ